MLANTLKRLVFLARSTKKAPPQQPNIKTEDESTKSEGYSHPISPTLKKIQKRYNQSMKKQKQQEDELMKGLEQFQSSIFMQNEKRKKSKQQKEKEAQEYLQNLQIPPNLRQKMKSMYNQSQPTQLSKKEKQTSNIEDEMDLKALENNNTNVKIQGRFIKSKQQANQVKKMILGQQDPLEAIKLRQQMMIAQILKGSKEKQASLNLPNSWKKQLQEKKKQKQEQEYVFNEKLRYQKLKEISSQDDPHAKNAPIRSNSQLRKLERLTDKYKIEVSPDEVWRSKYSPQLIESAIDYKNKELSYFKELVEPSQRDIWDQIRETTMLKPSQEFKERKRKNRQLIKAEDEKKNKQLGVTAQYAQQQGLTRYKDLQFYKEKGVKQFQQTQNVDSYDVELRQAAKKDLNQVNKLSDIFLDEFADPEEVRLQKKQVYEKSSFGKYEIKLKQMSRKMVELGIEHDFEDLALLKKQQLFADKKIQQQNASYKQYLIKKQKKKHMKQELKKIHKQKLRQDLNFDYELDPVKLQKLNPLQMQQGLKKMQEINKMKENTIVSSDFIKQKIHYTKTLRGMSQFIAAYFYNNFENANNTINQKIQVGNIIPNRKNTVLNVFWQFHPNYVKLMENYKFDEEDINQQKKALQQKLQKQSTYISSKMTQYLGLRYGPDIRFYFNQILTETRQSIQQMKKYKQQIIQLTIQEYKQKGLIKTPQQQQQYRKKIGTLAKTNLQDINNQKKLISKVYQKKQRTRQKIQRRNQNKKKKQNNSQQQSAELKLKKKYSTKQLEEMALAKIITQRVEKRKESIFTPYIEDQELYFGEEVEENGQKKIIPKKGNNNIPPSDQSMRDKRGKKSPVDRLWEDIQRGI